MLLLLQQLLWQQETSQRVFQDLIQIDEQSDRCMHQSRGHIHHLEWEREGGREQRRNRRLSHLIIADIPVPVPLYLPPPSLTISFFF